MLKLGHALVLALCCIALICREAAGQSGEELYLYGYLQTNLYRQTREATVFERLPVVPVKSVQKFKNTSFSLQQLNLFLNKPFSERFTAFVNLEFQASYSSQRQSGALALQEGWVSYSRGDQLNLKAGLLLPVFNNLNEIQNRLPLFPYLFRPTVYEALFRGQVDIEDYLPEQAYLQLSGFVPVGALRLDYAAHVGNSESSYLATAEPASGTSIGAGGTSINLFRGEDLSYFKAYGGRVGVRSANERFKFGISATYDHDKRDSLIANSISRLPDFIVPNLGKDVPRLRLGTDLSWQVGPWELEGEYIRVLHDLEYAPLPELSLDKRFYYASLLYNFTDQLFVYGGYSFLNNETFEAVKPDSPDRAGIKAYSAGGGYKLTEVLGLKWQYIHARFGENPYLKLRSNWLFLGFSLIF